jgi:protein O-GlcNAc transferase
MRTDQCLTLAKERHLAGDLASARTLYETVLAGEPANADVMFRLGVLGPQCTTYNEALTPRKNKRCSKKITDAEIFAPPIK